MGSISHLQPQKVFGFFEEICHIPHGSKNLQQISDYFVKFAKDRNLEEADVTGAMKKILNGLEGLGIELRA